MTVSPWLWLGILALVVLLLGLWGFACGFLAALNRQQEDEARQLADELADDMAERWPG